MILHHTGSKDTYITNKVIGGISRATGANVGYSSTIDMFKLYNESHLRGTTSAITELSRGLIQFDLATLKTNITNEYGAGVLTDSTLSIKLVLSDVQGTQVAPTDYTLELRKLSQAWTEGIGDNIVTFGDLHAANWISGSLDVKWNDGDPTEGGYYDSSTEITQTFAAADENLEMDVTTWVKAVWSGATDYGWILKFTDALEADAKSYFVKRFATRHSRNVFLRPKLVVSWSSHHQDSRLHFEAGSSNKISIRNYVNGSTANFGGTPTVCTLSYASWSANASSIATVDVGNVTQTGMYEATFGAIDLYGSDSALKDDLVASGSILLQERWYDRSNATQVIHSGSLYLKNPLALSSGHARDLRFSIVDLKSKYTSDSNPVIRLFVRERNLADEPVRIPIELPSTKVQEAYYQIKDSNSGLNLIPFSYDASTPDYSTRISSDARGMYFSFPTSILPRGRTYTIDILYLDRGERRIFESNQAFRVQ